MREFIDMSRAAAADLAAAFHNDPRAELAAWFRVALEREGMIARLYDRRAVESRFASLPAHLARSAIAMLNGIGVREEEHVSVIRELLAAAPTCLHVALKERWGRLQGLVLHQLASANVFARAVALLMLRLGARSTRERMAARTVAGLDTGGFLALSRTLEITAVESYQRMAGLLAAVPRPEGEGRYSVAVDLKILEILRDERVHRDVFHVLHKAVSGAGIGAHFAESEVTELPDDIAARPISSPPDLQDVCRAILAFHYGAALPAGAPPEEVTRVAAGYWHWQMEDPRRGSYLVDCQRQNVFRADGDVLLLGTAGLEDVARGRPFVRSHGVSQRLVASFAGVGESLQTTGRGAARARYAA